MNITIVAISLNRAFHIYTRGSLLLIVIELVIIGIQGIAILILRRLFGEVKLGGS